MFEMIAYLFSKVSRLLAGHGLGRNAVVAWIYVGIAKMILPDFIFYRGHKIWVDSPNSLGLSVFGHYTEEFELSLFENEISKESIVLDVGANIGLYTLAAARKNAKLVYSFEPDFVSFANLKRNVETNNYSNVAVENYAVSDKTGHADLTVTSKYPLDRGNVHLISSPQERKQRERRITVDTICLDEFFADKHKHVDIAKIDVEGLEYEVLRGMSNLITANQTMKMFIEFNPYALKRHGTDVDSFIGYMYVICSCIYYIDETSKSKVKVTKEWLSSYAKNIREDEHINLLALKDSTAPIDKSIDTRGRNPSEPWCSVK
jgi:FkbM family methyltransferase